MESVREEEVALAASCAAACSHATADEAVVISANLEKPEALGTKPTPSPVLVPPPSSGPVAECASAMTQFHGLIYGSTGWGRKVGRRRDEDAVGEDGGWLWEARIQRTRDCGKQGSSGVGSIWIGVVGGSRRWLTAG